MIRLLLPSLAALALVGAVPAQAMEPVRHFPNQKTAPGFYKGKSLRYLDLGPVKLAGGNRVAPIWAFANGADEQKNVVDVVPGDRAYTPLWRVSMVRWKEGVEPRVLRSAAQIRAAAAAGDVTIMSTRTVVNCPIV